MMATMTGMTRGPTRESRTGSSILNASSVRSRRTACWTCCGSADMWNLLVVRLMSQRSDTGSLQERCQECRVEESRSRGVEEIDLEAERSISGGNVNGAVRCGPVCL